MASSLFGKQPNSPQQNPKNNPLQDIMQAMHNGQNPREFVRQMAANNPVWKAVNDAIGMQSPQQMGAQIDQSARGQGTSLNALMTAMVKRLGLPIH